MTVFSYRTLQSPGEGMCKEKGSKFLSFAYPVEDESDIKNKLEHLRKEYFDATHHCYAYMLEANKSKFRAFDDGEPNHSAGDPILGQIRSKNITHVLVVVVRYFGGLKLGVGGLIDAYRAAAEDALNKAVIVEKEILRELRITYSYSGTPEVMRLVKDFELVIINQSFEDQCLLEATYKLRHEIDLFAKINFFNATGHSIRVLR